MHLLRDNERHGGVRRRDVSLSLDHDRGEPVDSGRIVAHMKEQGKP
jgi:hypothetical protein